MYIFVEYNKSLITLYRNSYDKANLYYHFIDIENNNYDYYAINHYLSTNIHTYNQ